MVRQANVAAQSSRARNRLSPIQVQRASKPGLLHDGAGLYLNISKNGGKSWLFRYEMGGRARWMGLGSFPEITLARARDKALDARRLKVEGIDPLDQRRTERQVRGAKAAAGAITFKACSERYIAAHEAGWHAMHARQWARTLEDYAYPTIGDLPVGAVETGHITQILQPIWTTKTETAKRLRGRIEMVLDYAKTHGWRSGENPARWKGHLANVLAQPRKVAKVRHYAALPWREIEPFMAELTQQVSISALALRFAILTAARTGEVVGAQWSEIDLQNLVWTVPLERMKARVEHRVPLSDAAVQVLHEVARLGTEGFVFPGRQPGKGLNPASGLLDVLTRMGRGDLTTHGFRSTFRDWAAETGKPADIAEAALAHTLGNKTQAAYQRGDLLARRRKLMEQWAEWCNRPEAEGENVVTLERAG
jgi:integrase